MTKTKATEPEEIIRNYLRERFPGKRFHRNYRPNFLRNPKTGYNLELDFYHNKLKLAIEYNGPHHTDPNNYLYLQGKQSKKDFKIVQEHDRYKREVCEKEEIYLIVVPCSVKDIPEFLDQKLADRY